MSLENRTDSPTLPGEAYYPDSPTLAPVHDSHLSSLFFDADTPSPLYLASPVIHPHTRSDSFPPRTSSYQASLLCEEQRPRNGRRGYSILGGVLLSKDGSSLVPIVDELKAVFENQDDSDTDGPWATRFPLPRKTSLISGKESLLSPPHSSKKDQSSEEEWVDGSSSWFDTKTKYQKGAFNTFEPMFDSKQPRRTSSKMNAPPPLKGLGERTGSFGNWDTPPVTPGLEPPTTPKSPEDIPFDALLKIRQAMVKAKQRAYQNVNRLYDDKSPIPLSTWEEHDKRDNGEELQHEIAEKWAQLSIEIGLTNRSFQGRRNVDWHQKGKRFAPLRFSVAFTKLDDHRDTGDMEAELAKKDPTGRWRAYRRRVNSLRMQKLKEAWRPSMVKRLQKEAAESRTELDFDPELDFEAPFRAFNITPRDPNPTMTELLNALIPINDGLHPPPSTPPSHSDPFASVYSSRRAIASWEHDASDPPPSPKRKGRSDPTRHIIEPPEPRKLKRNLSIRFSAHNFAREFLKETRRQWLLEKEATTATDVVWAVMDFYWSEVSRTVDLNVDAPVRKEGVESEMEQWQYVTAYLNVWAKRCERQGW